MIFDQVIVFPLLVILSVVITYFISLKIENKQMRNRIDSDENLLNEYTRAFRYISRTHKGLVNEAFASVNEDDKRA